MQTASGRFALVSNPLWGMAAMKTVLIVGIGPGGPDQITVEAVKALNRCDLLFVAEKGEVKAGLAAARREICARHVTNPSTKLVTYDVPPRPARAPDTDYKAAIVAWRGDVAGVFSALIDTIQEGGSGAFLVWGDPALYDGTIEIVDGLARATAAFDWQVIAGVGAPSALAARHRVPLNRVGESIATTTGRRFAQKMPDADNVVVMLDGETAFTVGQGDDLEVFWGAYLGLEEEILLAGPLNATADTIVATRAAARERVGWIMDTYLIRRKS